MKRLAVAVWWIAAYIVAAACAVLLLAGAVAVVQVAASGPAGVAWLLGAALCTAAFLWQAARRDRDRALNRLWDARIREQELTQERDALRRQVQAYRNASDEFFERLLDNTGEH